MRLTTLSDSILLTEQHKAVARSVLKESCDGLTKDQRLIVEGIYNDLMPLIEASLSTQQIQQIFGDAEKAATAAGSNRTFLGKGVDTAKKANEIINSIGRWLQNTTPVQNFDAKFEKLKLDINKKFPDSKILDGVSNLGIWVKDNPGKTAAVIGILTAIAALTTGPVGGAIAGQVLRGSAELLKGEKLSTAVGKGAKAAALGWLTGKAVDFIGNALSDPVESAAREMGRGIVKANYKATIDEIGGEFGNRFGTFTTGQLYGKAEDIADIKDVWKAGVDAWKEGEYLRSDAMFKSAAEMTAKLADPQYVQSVTDTADTAKTMMAAAKEMQGFFDKMGDVAQGAASGISGKDKKESYYTQQRPLSEGQVYVLFNRVAQLNEAGFLSRAAGKIAQAGTNLTTKITADKLNKAWQKAGSPTDSEELAKLLTAQGVTDDAVKQIYTSMKLPVPGAAPQAAAVDFKAVKSQIAALPLKQKQRLITFVTKQLQVQPK